MSKILGIKLTHDAAVAGIDGNELIFSVEVEKVNNNLRYSKMPEPHGSFIDPILKKFNFKPDLYVVDGWKHGKIGEMPVCGYHASDSRAPYFDPVSTTHGNSLLKINGVLRPYLSFTHMDSHVIGAYVTSPFSRNKESAVVITWDGGQNPRIHSINHARPEPIMYMGPIFELYGIIYGIMGYYFGPYKRLEVITADIRDGVKRYGGYDKPGKLMSFLAFGTANGALMEIMDSVYTHIFSTRSSFLDKGRDARDYNQDGIAEHEFCRQIYHFVQDFSISDADVLASIHEWLGNKLVEGAKRLIPKGKNLCFAGGSALNIKWNSMLRDSGHFASVWVPPFPNDAGSAIGTAAAAMVTEGEWHLNWNVYCGPEIEKGKKVAGWGVSECNMKQLAELLVYGDPLEPVVFLNGRAEAGPRALGNRSIFANANFASNWTRLNIIKDRETFRPVAPICREEEAPQIFSPGTPDPYMLFDHKVRESFQPLIPAVVHFDKTARLQTVNAEQNPAVYELLTHVLALSSYPLLCNTSANHNGSGFFPDLESALKWGKTKYVWCDGKLYTNQGGR